MLRYKIVETSTVTDDELERIVNEWVSQGWELDGFQFVNRESSQRPAMAFIIFTTPTDDEFDDDDDDLDSELEDEGATN